MKTIITEVFYRDFLVGCVISRAVLTKTIGSPFDYRAGYSMVVRPNADKLASVRQKANIAHEK